MVSDYTLPLGDTTTPLGDMNARPARSEEFIKQVRYLHCLELLGASISCHVSTP